jgi:hypothetical protein
MYHDYNFNLILVLNNIFNCIAINWHFIYFLIQYSILVPSTLLQPYKMLL